MVWLIPLLSPDSVVRKCPKNSFEAYFRLYNGVFPHRGKALFRGGIVAREGTHAAGLTKVDLDQFGADRILVAG
jgi:hypothetical protein